MISLTSYYFLLHLELHRGSHPPKTKPVTGRGTLTRREYQVPVTSTGTWFVQASSAMHQYLVRTYPLYEEYIKGVTQDCNAFRCHDSSNHYLLNKSIDFRSMTFRSNQYRRHYSEEEGEIGEEEGEIASPVRTPSANLTSTIAPLSAPVSNNNNNSNANHAAINPSGINTINLSALQPTNRLPAPINRGPRSLPDRGFRRAPAFPTSAGRGSGWPLRRSWSEQSPGPPSGGIQRTPSFSGRSNAPTSDVFRSSDPRNNHSRPTDPRNLGHTEVTSLSNSGGPLRPTDPRQLTTPINDTASGESPNRTEQGPPHVHRSPSLNKPVRNLSFVAGRGNGPHVPTSSFNNVPPFRPGIFSSRPGRGNGNRRDSFTVQPQQRDTSFNRAGSDEPFRRPAEALDPFGRAPRTESLSTETFGRIPQPERSSEAVDMFGRTPIARIERQNSDSSFRSRSAGDEPGLIRPRSDDSFYNRPLLLERNQSEPVDSGFGGLGSGRVGQSTGPRRFSSYSSLANDHSVPPRIEHPPHRTVDQVTFNRPRQSPSNRDTGSGSPQKTLLVTQPSDPSLEVIPKPLFSEGDPRKKAAEIRGYSAPQASMLDRQDSRGFIAPPALMKPDSRSYEQNVLEHHDSRGHQQPPMEKQGNKIPSVPHTTFEVPDTGRPITVERLTIPPKSPFWNGPFPRRDPRAVENRPKPPENHTSTKPETQKLTCSSLGDPEVVRRAEDAVKELCELVGIPSLAEGNGSSQLPTKQLIMKAMTMLDIKIKDCQASVERADKALSNAIVEESKERQRLEKQKLEETAREKEEVASKRREEIQKQDQALIDLRSKLKNEIEIRRQSFEFEKKGIEESLVDRIKQAKSEFKKRKKLELKEQLEHAGLVFNTGINKAQRQVQKALKEAANAKTNATGAAAHYQLKLQESEATSRLPNLQHEAGINELIAKIVEENKQRAAQAQDESLSLLPVFQSDNESVDPKHGKTNEEWTNLARHVTGLTDALYAEPSESPYFDQINDAYELIGPVVKEYVRDMKRQLTERWHELAEEYVVRTSLYGKKVKKRGATKGNSASGAKPRCHRSSILGFDGSSAPSTTSSAIADSGNGGGAGRSTNNPYRRARRGHAGGAVGDVVRSEYEQEQIIAELTAKEAMEKRIAHGGSKLPRQICRLERELTASYFNTFTHQRVFDPMEESYKQSITNVWTDMEKCIFLDRFMQHPKDFRKIASFLRNKTTRDCISYYYASKQIVPYKQALKEHLMRRKRRGEYHNWDSTIQAALASGSKVMAGTSEDKPLVFHLPEDDNTYHTSKLHPMKREILDAIDISLCHYDEASLDGVQSKKRKRQKEPWFILDTEQRKFLRQVEKEPVVAAKHPSDDQPKIPRTSSGSSIISEKCGVVEKGMLGRKAHKWTAEDKRQFFETIEKHGECVVVIFCFPSF